MKRILALLVIALELGCAGAPQPTTAPTGGTQSRPDTLDQQLIAPGLGTLRQDEFTVQLRSDQLLIKVTPLAETVIRTAAPDTYNRLHDLAESRRAEAVKTASPASNLELFLVSFFSYQPNTAYQPENLQLTQQGRQLRAAAILPLTPGWGRQQLQQQETQMAVYAFAHTIDYELPFTVRYLLVQSEDWTRIIPRLDTERAKIRARGHREPNR